MAKKKAVERWADHLFQVVPCVGEDPKPSRAITAETGLTQDQIYDAAAFIRDNYPEFPLVSSAKGYHFTVESGLVDRYRLARVKTGYTTIRRTWQGVVRPYLETLEDRKLARATAKQYERVLEDVRELLEA
jgi:hypothetical protein